MYVVIVSGVAAAIHFSMALICLALARAPGWQSYRVFAVIASLMGIYAVNDALLLHGTEVTKEVEFAAVVNVSIASLVGALWLIFSRLRDAEALTRLDKVLLSFLIPAFILTFVPGLIVDGVHPTVIGVLDITYQTPTTTAAGAAVFFVALVTMLIIASRYVRRARAGNFGEKLSAAGFTVFVLLATEEVLVGYGLLEWPYLADLGFAGITLSFAVEMSSRVSDESNSLADLNRTLGKRVDSRSADLAETREALLVAERHAALGQLASGVGHEINNPLAYVAGNLSFLREHEGPHPWTDEEREAIDEAIDGVDRIRRIVADLTVFAGGERETQDIADVERATRTAMRIVSPRSKSHVNFQTDIVDCRNVAMDESKLTQVLVNLLANAAHASRGSSKSTITTRCTTVDDRQLIEVIDQGVGISAENLERIFDPLYTTKEVGEGTGLGLFVCRGLINDAGGTLSVRSQPGEGSTFSIILPATSREATTMATPPPKASPNVENLAPGLRIYIIDDEVRVARALERMLKGADVTVETDSRAALRHLEDGAHYDVIICDLMMPDLTGMELYKALVSAESPLCPRFLFVTGGAVSIAAESFLEREDIHCVFKPVMPGPLRQTLNEIALRESSLDRP